VIKAATEVHQIIGPGMIKSVYQECLSHELGLRDIPFEAGKKLPLEYKGTRLDSGFRLDFVVADKLVVELRNENGLQPADEARLMTYLYFVADKLVVELRNENGLQPADEARLMTYLYLTGTEAGLLINFNVPIIKDGIREIRN
jgi:GxxExxY protein